MIGRSPVLRQRLGWVLEGLLVAVLVVVALWYGRFAFLNSTEPHRFYQSDFGPAVMLAAGHGFVNPVPAQDSALADFLAERTPALAASDAVTARIAEFSQSQHAMRYLLFTVGAWWRVAGISWTAVADVAGALHALAVVASYALLRLFLPLVLSMAGALWMCASTLQLSYVVSVRDYSKGAFILAAIPLIVVLALRARSRRAMLTMAAATGAVIGVGLGFKMDVAVMAPIAIACAVLFRGRRPWTDLGEKSQAIAVLVLALLISAWPVLNKLSSGGSNAVHVILLGYADPFDAGLNIQPSVYGFLPFYDDGYVAAAVRTHGEGSANRRLTIPSPEYDKASQSLWLDLVRHFPADVFARSLAAATGILNLVFVNPESVFLSRPLPAHDTFAKVNTWLHRWNRWGVVLGVLLIVVASCDRVREGWLAACLLLALAGYPSVQFQPRHYFHLQAIAVLVVLLLAWIVMTAPFRVARAVAEWRRSNAPGRHRQMRQIAVRLVAAFAIVVAVTALPLGVLRAYQSRHIGDMLSAFVDGPHDRIDAELVQEGPNLWLARWPGAAGRELSPAQLAAYYLVELRAEDPPGPMTIGLRYRSTAPPLNDFSRTLSVSSPPGVAWLGFAVFGVPGEWEFEGVELGGAVKRRLTGIYRLDAGPAGLPLDVTLPADWRSLALFQQLSMERRLGRSVAPRRQLTVKGPATRGEQVAGLDYFLSEERLPDSGTVESIYTKTVSVAATGIAMDGDAAGESSYLVQFKPAHVGAGGALVARGRLDEGGITIGLLKDGRWYGQAVVNEPGDFTAVVPVRDEGVYVPLVTNALRHGERHNRFRIARFGLAEPR